MLEHVKILGRIGIARALLGVALGSYLIWSAQALDIVAYGLTQVTPDTVQFDRTAFMVIGGLCLAMAPVRCVQAILALKGRPSARLFGMGLAIWDAVNLSLFPVSTALGLYGIVVYHNPETVGYFESRRAWA